MCWTRWSSGRTPGRAELNRYWNDVLVTGVLGGERVRLGYDAAAGNYAGAGRVWTRAALLAGLGDGDVLNFAGVPAGSASEVLGRSLEAPRMAVTRGDSGTVVEWGDAPVGWYPEINVGSGEDGWRVLHADVERVERGWRAVLPDGQDGFVRLGRSW